MTSPPPTKKQKTSESELQQKADEEPQMQQENDDIQQQIPPHASLEQKANEEPQMQQENEDIQQQIPPHAGLEDQVPNPDQINGLEDLRCEEEDLQTYLREGEQVEIDGDYVNNLQIYIRNQLPALSVNGVDANVRGHVIDDMIRSSISGLIPPLAVHLAVQLFDQYFASNSQAVRALNPHTVASSALSLAMKHLYKTDLVSGAQNHQGNEFEILNHILYRLNAPTTKMLVDAVIESTAPHAPSLVCLCDYFTELALLDRDCSNFQVTVLAAACIFMGQFVFDSSQSPKVRAPWECDAQRLREAVTILHELHLGRRLPSCQSVKSKFLEPWHRRVANLACPTTIPDSYF